MAINRYDTPAQAQFINTYSPIPFDEMMKIGLMKQANKEAGDKAADEAVASLSSFQVAPFDEKEYINVRRGYENKLNDLQSNGGDTGSYEFRRGIAKLRTEMSMDPILRGMQYNLGQYQTAMKSKEQANEAGVTSSNSFALDKSIQDIFEVGGTKGLMEKTGNTKWSPGGWRKNADPKGGIEKYIDNVAESSSQFDVFSKDANGSYIIDQSQAGKSLNALGSPFGIAFVEGKDAVTGKKKLEMKLGEGASRIMTDFFATADGQDLYGQAVEEAHKKGLPNTEVGKIAAEKYFSMVGSSINERVNTKGTYDIAYDPKYLADYNRSQEDKNFMLTTGMHMGIPPSSITSQKDVYKAQAGFNNTLADIDARQKEYIKTNNVVGNGAGQIDSEGKEVSMRLLQYQAERDQIVKSKADLDAKMLRAKREAGIGEDWQVEQEIQAKYAGQKFKSTLVGGPSEVDIIGKLKQEATIYANALYGSGASTADHKAAYDEKYAQLLQEKSGKYKQLEAILERDSKASSEIVGVTNFPTKTAESYFEKGFNGWSAEGGDGKSLAGGSVRLRNMSTLEPLTPDERKNLSSTRDPKVIGTTFSSADGNLQIVYRPYSKDDKNGNAVLLDPIVMDAPEGTIDYMIDNGFTNEAVVALKQQVPDMEASRDKSATIGLNGINIKIHKLTPTELQTAPAGVNYSVVPVGTAFTKETTGPDGKPVQGAESGTPVEYTGTDISSILKWYLEKIYLPNSPNKATVK
jgi:hypothetical protein